MQDPCDYCVDKHGIKDINGINNCCYQQCANSMATTDMNQIIGSPCGNECKKCLDKAKDATGRDPCYMSRIKPPLIWKFTEGFEQSAKRDSGNSEYSSYSSYRKSHPVVFYVSLIVSMLILLFLLLIIVKVIFGKNNK